MQPASPPKTFEEHTALTLELASEGWRGEDKDGDGFISVDEWFDRNLRVLMIYASHSDRLYEQEFLEALFGPINDRISGPAIKGGRSQPFRTEFARFDSQSKGFLTLEEIKKMMRRRFDLLDSNKDGRLSRKEVIGR